MGSRAAIWEPLEQPPETFHPPSDFALRHAKLDISQDASPISIRDGEGGTRMVSKAPRQSSKSSEQPCAERCNPRNLLKRNFPHNFPTGGAIGLRQH
mmetsp:Transcript_14981/g.44868  ORF Transcript_14981/g.44868 Transcript_14981/m.44868 type:complete len:97 (-) Transcript_14981:129-419(-)